MWGSGYPKDLDGISYVLNTAVKKKFAPAGFVRIKHGMARPIRGADRRSAKLTLSLEAEQRERFHAYAKSQGKSLVEIICALLEREIAREEMLRRDPRTAKEIQVLEHSVSAALQALKDTHGGAAAKRAGK